MIVRMLNPKVGEMVDTSSCSKDLQIVVLPALSRPLTNSVSRIDQQHRFELSERESRRAVGNSQH